MRMLPLLVVPLGVALLAGCGRQPAAPAPAPSPAPAARQIPPPFFPLGVYWPWETTCDPAVVPEPRAERLEPFLAAQLDDLAAHHVTVIWTVNGPDTPAETGLLCRLAAARGIRILAGSGHWGIHAQNQGSRDWLDANLRNGVNLWRDADAAARPLALVIADEPRQDGAPGWTGLAEFAAFAARFAEAGVPVTTTVEWGQRRHVYAAAPTLPFASMNIYPFFGSPHGWRGLQSYGAYSDNVADFVAAAETAGRDAWIMGQAYQELWGPGRVEADGSVTVLAGTGRHWLMPTPAQLRWQVWTAMAHGAKGFTFFAYVVPFRPGPGEPNPEHRAWAVTADTPSGGPMALKSFPEYLPGPQYRAMGETYGRLRPLAGLLNGLRQCADTAQLARPLADAPLPGTVVNLLRTPDNGALCLAVVAAPEEPNALGILLSPEVAGLEPVGDAPSPVPHPAPAPFRAVTVALAPGTGAFYRVVRAEPSRWTRELLFHEDFADDAFADRAAQAAGVRAEGAAGRPRILRATRGEANVTGDPFPSTACYLLYDLDRLAPRDAADNAGAVRFLEHQGWGVSPEAGQGVFIWAGPTPDQLAPLVSSAQPRRLVPLAPQHRFLKIGIAFRQATPDYAGLHAWSLVRWRPRGKTQTPSP